MWCNQIFSLIHTDKIQNIIVCDNYEVANVIARNTYGDDAFAVETTLYPVSIGYKYQGGLFYDNDGNVIERNLTEEEEIRQLKYENDNLKSTNAFLENCILELSEEVYK